jgi:3-hydroxyisobutyrate dehydrogenase
MTVVFAGLGAMGYPMAGRLALRFPTAVWNRTSEVADRHSAEFGTRAVDVDDFGDADVVVTCLASSAVVATLVDRVLPQLNESTVWVDCTSGQPEPSRTLAARLASRGIEYLDAPVSGMAAGARAGTLTAIVGGSAEALDTVRPVLDSMCAQVVHAGGVGAGHLVKAANNTLFAGSFWLVAEVLARLADAGIDQERALQCINASSGRSFATERFVPDYVLPSPTSSSYRLGQSHRDVETFLAATSAPRQEQLVGRLEHAYAELTAALGDTADAAPTFDAIGRR